MEIFKNINFCRLSKSVYDIYVHFSGNVVIDSQSLLNACYFIAIYKQSVNLAINDSEHQILISPVLSWVLTITEVQKGSVLLL